MSYQLLTTKRKFDRLLEQIANPTTPASSDSDVRAREDGVATRKEVPSDEGAIVERDAKRRKMRLGPSTSILRERSHFVKSSPHLSLLLTQFARQRRLLQYHRPTDKEQVAMDSGTFNPQSQRDFLERLKTFSNVLDWAEKPSKMNEKEWAKRGWRLQGPERVCCETCLHFVTIEMVTELSGPLASAEADEEEEEEEIATLLESAREDLATKYAEFIIEAHDEGCPWKRMGCGDSIYRVPIYPAVDALEKLLARYQKLVRQSKRLPKRVVAGETSADTDVVFQALLSYFPAHTEGFEATEGTNQDHDEDASPADCRKRALIMALAGWKLTTVQGEKTFEYAECDMCFRRVGLWLLGGSSSRDSITSGELLDSFDVLDEHRDHCPWKNPSTQCPVLSGLVTPRSAMEQLSQCLVDSAASQVRKHEEFSPRATIPTTVPTEITTPTKSRTQEETDETQSYREEASAVEKADAERKKKLHGLKTFFDKFKDVRGGKQSGK